jgi:hypothetical protein
VRKRNKRPRASEKCHRGCVVLLCGVWRWR